MYQHNLQCTYDSIYTTQINASNPDLWSEKKKHVFLRDPPQIEHPPLEKTFLSKKIHEKKAAWNSQDSFCHPSFTWSWWVFLRSPWNACWLVLQFLGLRKLSGKCLLDMQGEGGKTHLLDYGGSYVMRCRIYDYICMYNKIHNRWYIASVLQYTMHFCCGTSPVPMVRDGAAPKKKQLCRRLSQINGPGTQAPSLGDVWWRTETSATLGSSIQPGICKSVNCSTYWPVKITDWNTTVDGSPV